MSTSFANIDWLVVLAYLLLLTGFGWWSNRGRPADARDYFLGGNTMSFWLVAVSVLATTQSAATFLGGPDQGYRGDFTYVAASGGALLAAIFVSVVLVPRFYALRATTVYELLNERHGPKAVRSTGLVYLIGRLFASGARLYLAAIAVSMILFGNVEPASIVFGSFLMMIIGLLITVSGGIRSVIWSDLVQFIVYTGSALTVLYFLFHLLPMDVSQITEALRNAPDGSNKLQFWDTSLDLSKPFNLISIVTGIVLINIGNFGMDQDTTQRILTCKNHRHGGQAIIISSIAAVPIIFLFVLIGQLLHLYYDRPDLVAVSGDLQQTFKGERITVFMNFILEEIPPGLRGLVTVGVIAASISTINSGLNSMSSVIVQDFYRPWKLASKNADESHFVLAGRLSMAIVGMGLFLMSVLCLYWQRYTDMPLLEFALSVMVFAYSGLMGVFFCAVFTRRGSSRSVAAALIAGFVVTTLQQPYIVDQLGLPDFLKRIAFTWQLCLGTLCSFLVAISASGRRSTSASQAARINRCTRGDSG